MLRITSMLLVWTLMVLPAQAEITPEVQRLSKALGLVEIVDVMHAEGIAYGDELAESMFPGPVSSDWRAVVTGIYDTDRMKEVAINGFAKSIAPADVELLTRFFESALGAEIIALEISARLALMDDAVDEANNAHVAAMIKDDDPRIALIDQFIEVNKLLESNVVGALNSNYAFFTGLVDGGAYEDPLSDEEILREVWSQEADIRKDTQEWLYGFLSMAYSPLSDEELMLYIKLSETPEGQALNNALFDGFDALFNAISHELGLAAAREMSSEEL